MSPPVDPRPRQLPFHGSSVFTWETFEEFFCAFLDARPQFPTADDRLVRIVSAERNGGRGDPQEGVDIRARMDNGEEWAFQCKHVSEWGPQDTRDAIAACTRPAARKFLLVTKPTVSAATRAVLDEHPDWELWDGEGISRRFLDRDVLSPAQAARLLHTFFGPGWAQALLGLPSLGALQAPEAWFAPFVSPNGRRSLRTTLVGRERELAALDAFVGHKKHRALFLVGAGGIGKSRLLRAWTTDFSRRHPGWTVRYVLPTRGDFAAAISAETRRPLMLVLDDAHAFVAERRALMVEFARADNVKLVLGLRPGPQDAVRADLREAGFDTLDALAPHVELGALALADAERLVVEVAPTDLPRSQRGLLARISRDCPLIADIAGHLLSTGRLAAADIRDDPRFRDEVFAHLLRAAEPMFPRFSEACVKDLLGLIALLAPVEPDREFRDRAARFLEGMAAHHLVDLLDALEAHGLLLRSLHPLINQSVLRVTPDLLSDHLAYTACYDRFRTESDQPRDRGFVARLLKHFPPDDFPRLLRHLAQAEWRAGTDADSVVEPLWQSFVRRFDASPSVVREEQLAQWRNIAHLQPRRTLQLAEHVLVAPEAPPLEGLPPGFDPDWDTQRSVVACLPSLLQPVGEHHSGHTQAVLDFLWRLARDEEPRSYQTDTSALDAIAGVLALRPWKPPQAHQAALAWAERFFCGDEWLHAKPLARVLLNKLLSPLFANEEKESAMTSSAMMENTRNLVPIAKARHVRETGLSVCRQVLARRDSSLALAVVELLDVALRPARMPRKASTAYLAAWDDERAKALAVFSELLRAYPEPALQFVAGRTLRDTLRFVRETAAYLAAARSVLATIPDHFDLRIARVCLGYPESDVVESRHADRREADKLWTDFTRRVAEELTATAADPLALLQELERRRSEWDALGLRPHFRPLIGALGTVRPSVALAIAEHLLATPEHAFAQHFDSWVLAATAESTEARLDWFSKALATGAEPLVRAAIFGLGSWRRQGGPTETILALLLRLAPGASPVVARELVGYVWLNDHHPHPGDWDLLCALRSDTAPDLPLMVFSKAAQLLASLPPADESQAAKIIGALGTAPTLTEPATEEAFRIWARRYPVEVFKLLWRRLADGRDTPDHFQSSLDAADLDPHSAELWQSPEIAGPLLAAECRVVDGAGTAADHRLIATAFHYADGLMSSRMERLIADTTTRDALTGLAHLFAHEAEPPFILSHPRLCEQLLARSGEIGTKCHAEVLERLALMPGSRGTEEGAPSSDWNTLLKQLETAVHHHAASLELGALYRRALSIERNVLSRFTGHR